MSHASARMSAAFLGLVMTLGACAAPESDDTNVTVEGAEASEQTTSALTTWCEYNGALFQNGTVAFPSSAVGFSPNAVLCTGGKFQVKAATATAKGCQWGAYWAQPNTLAAYKNITYLCSDTEWFRLR